MKAVRVQQHGCPTLALSIDDIPVPEPGHVPIRVQAGCLSATDNFSIVGVMLAWVSELPLAIRKLGINPFPRAVADGVHSDLLKRLADKRIRPTLERRVSLEKAAAALEDHENRKTCGRTAVVIAA